MSGMVSIKSRTTSDARTRFLNDTARHAMQVLRDDGLYRHLHFAAPGTYCQSFDIATWPGRLCYTGDMGTYVFARLPDMFEFFRQDPNREPNFDYWSEKCEARDRDGIRIYSPDLFRAAVRGDVDEFVRRHRLNRHEAKSLREQVAWCVLAEADVATEAVGAVGAFVWQNKGQVFPDFWEHRLEEFAPRFIWCCYALPWAIAKYDAAVAPAAEPATPGMAQA
ncbi:MAG: hypothetical protein AB7K63_18195 [Vicinamibacterales bacterium]